MSKETVPRYETRSTVFTSSGETEGTIETNLAREGGAGKDEVINQMALQNEQLAVMMEQLIDNVSRREESRCSWDGADMEGQRKEQLELERKRLELEKEMFRKSSSQYEADKKKRKRATICQQLKQWDDKTEPEAYLDNFELTMEEAEMPVKLWLGLLRKQLTGKALTAHKEISLSPETPYLEVKQALLERMGATARQARRTYWLKKPKQDEGPESFLEQALRTITRIPGCQP